MIDPDASVSAPDLDYVFLLFTNRCGSNFLAQILASTRKFNVAGEVFNADTIESHSRDHDLNSFQDYFCYMANLQAYDGRVAAKLNIEQAGLLQEAGVLDALRGRSHFVLLERQDRLAQAVSRVIAWQNQQWTSDQPRRIPDANLVYSRGRILEEMAVIEIENGMLYRFLSTNRITPIHLAYEHLVADPQAHIDTVARRLGLADARYDPSRVRLVRQANHINEKWTRRFLAGD